MRTEIWQHKTSGEQYVVTWTMGQYARLVHAAAGPLHHSEVEQALAQGFDSDPELVADLEANQYEYSLVN